MKKNSLLAITLTLGTFLNSVYAYDVKGADLSDILKSISKRNQPLKTNAYPPNERTRVAGNTLLEKYSNNDNIYFSLFFGSFRADFGSTNKNKSNINYMQIKSPENNIRNLIFENLRGDYRPEMVHVEYDHPIKCATMQKSHEWQSVSRVRMFFDWNSRKSYNPTQSFENFKFCKGGLVGNVASYLQAFEYGIINSTRLAENQLKN